MTSQTSGIWTVCSTVCSIQRQRKRQISPHYWSFNMSRRIHSWLVNAPVTDGFPSQMASKCGNRFHAMTSYHDKGRHGPFARYIKLRVAHAPGMPGTFSPPPRVDNPDMHHGTCITHVPWCMPGSQTSGFLWSRWRGKRSRYSRRMRKTQFYVSGKRPILTIDTAVHYM